MPITWGVDHDNRVVSATGSGVLTKTDFDAYLDELAAAATLLFGKIFHMAAGCRLQLSKDDLLAVGVHQSMGRVAVVAASDELYEEAEKFNSKVLAERPLRIFRMLRPRLLGLLTHRSTASISRSLIPGAVSMIMPEGNGE
jgi:hypothetical protein